MRDNPGGKNLVDVGPAGAVAARHFRGIHADFAVIHVQPGEGGQHVFNHLDAPAVLAPLVGVADALVFTRSRYRGADPGGLLEAWEGLDTPSPAEVVDSPREALERATQWAGEGGAVVVTGSTFVVDEALNPEAELLEANALYVPPGEAPERE